MRAVGITQFGGPDALHIVDLPDPEAGQHPWFRLPLTARANSGEKAASYPYTDGSSAT
jgi:hypothetical protein